MKSHELAKELLSLPDRDLTISVDISTCDADCDNRVFTDGYLGVNDIESDELVLLFSGALNTS